MRHIRFWLLAAAAIALVGGAGLALAMRRPAPSRPVADAIAEGSELDLAFSYDAATGLIAFGTDSGEPGLWELPAGAERPRQLPVDGIFVRHPELSPGARFIAYHSLDLDRRSWEHRLLLMNRATGAARLVRETGDDEFVSRTAFSPDGRRLVYELVHHRADGSWADELRLVDVDSGADRSLVAEAGVPARGPGWARDGSAVYFVSGVCLRAVPVAGGASRQLACVDGATPAGSPAEPVAVSPDGARVAFTVDRDNCSHIAVVNLTARRAALVDAAECAGGARFVDDGALAYVAQDGDGGRAPRVRSRDGAAGWQAPRTLGFSDGITYALAPTGDGRVVALLGAPGLPRSLWTLDPRGAAPAMRYSPLDAAQLAAVGGAPEQVRVRSRDGLEVPVRIFPGAGRGRRPAVLFVHPGIGGRDDVAARIYPEIGYLTALGYTVVAPNFRGSTGYGHAWGARSVDSAGKLDDLDAAIELMRGRPDVDTTRLALFGSCYGNSLVPSLLERRPGVFLSVVEWVGPPMPWLGDEAAPDEKPLLSINGRLEHGSEGYGHVAEAARRDGHHLRFVELDESHYILHGAARARALRAIGGFLDETLRVSR